MTCAPIERIAIGKADVVERVIAVAARQLVCTRVARDIVITSATLNDVIASLPVKRVAEIAADQCVITVA